MDIFVCITIHPLKLKMSKTSLICFYLSVFKNSNLFVHIRFFRDGRLLAGLHTVRRHQSAWREYLNSTDILPNWLRSSILRETGLKTDVNIKTEMFEPCHHFSNVEWSGLQSRQLKNGQFERLNQFGQMNWWSIEKTKTKEV